MAHVDDLTFINAAQLLGSDNLYIGRPSDGADPDKRTDIDELIARMFGPGGTLPVGHGTFTPVLGGSSGDPTVTYTVQTGDYTRIGPLVFARINLAASAVSGGSGNAEIQGLPFTPTNGLAGGGAVEPRNLGLTGGRTSLTARVNQTRASVTLIMWGSGLDFSTMGLSAWSGASNPGIRSSVTYITDEP